MKKAMCGLSLVLPLLLAVACDHHRNAPLPPATNLKVYSIAVAERALALAPRSRALGLFHLGKAHERFGEEDRALELYGQAIELNGHMFEPYQALGFILAQRKDRMPEAIEAYQQALRCAPTMPGTLSRLGLVFQHMNRLDDALLSLTEEIRGGTANEDTYFYKGQTLALQGLHAEAVKSFEEAVKLAPDRREAHYALSQSLRALGQDAPAAEAEKKFKELKAREDAATASRPAVSSNQEEQAAHAAKTWLDAAALLAAESALIRDQRTLLRELQGEYFAAVREAKRIAPTDPEPRRVLIEGLEGFGDLNAAAQECSEALTVLPGEVGFAPRALELAMKLVEALGKDAPGSKQEPVLFALKLVEQAIAASPDYADAHREAARIIFFRLSDRQDMMAKAVQYALTAVKLAPTAMNYDVLALAYFRVQRQDLALKALEEGVQRNPGDASLKERLEKFRQQFQGN